MASSRAGVQPGGGSTNRRAPATATRVSPAAHGTSANPVSRPNAGSRARRSPDDEARQPYRLACAGRNAHAGMHMPAQRVAGSRRQGFVAQDERREQVRIGNGAHAPGRRRIAGVRVVIAAHQDDRQRRVRTAPAPERQVQRRDTSGRRMQEVAEDHEPRRTCALDQQRRDARGRWQLRRAGWGCPRPETRPPCRGASRRRTACDHAASEGRARSSSRTRSPASVAVAEPSSCGATRVSGECRSGIPKSVPAGRLRPPSRPRKLMCGIIACECTQLRPSRRIACAASGNANVRESVPRFSANLTFLWNEVPFLDRFAEAARAGFRAVEFAFAYEFAPEVIAARLAESRLECVLINAPPGDWNAGERGIASLPGTRARFRAEFRHRASATRTCFAVRASTCCPASCRRMPTLRRARGNGRCSWTICGMPARKRGSGG